VYRLKLADLVITADHVRAERLALFAPVAVWWGLALIGFGIAILVPP
jgi:hypothetical protein